MASHLTTITPPIVYPLSELPYEIQIMIWEESFEPRFIEMWDFNTGDGQRGWRGRCTTEDIVPIASKLCRASRDAFLRCYCLYIPSEIVRRNPPVYVNPLIDTVFLPGTFHHDNPFWFSIGGGIPPFEQMKNAIKRFRNFLNTRIEAEPEERGPLWRSRWEIRKLAMRGSVLERMRAGTSTAQVAAPVPAHAAVLLNNHGWIQNITATAGVPFATPHFAAQAFIATTLLATQAPTLQYDPTAGNFPRLGLLRNFPQLNDLVFLGDPAGSGINRFHLDHCPSIVVPDTEDELVEWERLTKLLGWMKSEENGTILAYPGWSDLKVSIAVYRPADGMAIVDRRHGMERFGPVDSYGR